MGDFVEDCVRVPPMGTSQIETIAEAFLAELAPQALQAPQPLDLTRMIDDQLDARGIVVYPASDAELGDREGATRPSDPIEVLLLDRLWTALFHGGKAESRARSTLAHELGHVVLHVPSIRRSLRYAPRGFTLNRAERGEVRPFEDSEWQAHTFAGAILMPVTTMRMVHNATLHSLAAAYNVSEAFVRSRLRRLKLEIPER